MHENKWREFSLPEYEIQDLGRPAFFLIPVNKLEMRSESGPSVRDDLHDFLLREFDAFTTAYIPSFGIWRNNNGRTVIDGRVQYRVSFSGKDRIPVLLKKLASIADMIKEDCIYIEAGQYAGLLYPKPSS